MITAGARTKVFITALTYPHPSKKYGELICTAGITSAHEWVRLYPIDYRYRPNRQRFHKYQWIEVELLKHPEGRDKRKESREPVLETMKLLGDVIPPGKDWYERRKIVDRMPVHTIKELEADYSSHRVSLGIVRPKRVIDLEIKRAHGKWKPNWQILYDQLRLFDPPKELRKIPYTFHYVFECEDSNRPHRSMIEDWELGVLFLREAKRLGSDKAAAQSVRKKHLHQMCADSRDTRFFMGTRFPYNTWLVLGVFWPPKETQGRLFE